MSIYIIGITIIIGLWIRIYQKSCIFNVYCTEFSSVSTSYINVLGMFPDDCDRSPLEGLIIINHITTDPLGVSVSLTVIKLGPQVVSRIHVLKG